jgi:uncharacterized protein
MSTITCAQVIACLNGSHRPAGRLRVQVIETHFAWVFLAGEKAYKLKKPVRQTSMDYRTLEARERGCRNELTLNRRLAPRIYLRVVPIVRKAHGVVTLGGRSGSRRGAIVDWLIEMQRLPAKGMLDRRIAARRASRADLDRIVRKLARFFDGATPRPMSDRAYLARSWSQIVENARELGARDLALSLRRIERVFGAQLELLKEHPEMLIGRGARLLDGHGDLRPEHVYVGSRASDVCVIDCLEFDPDLRRLDPAEEVAFLALECERLGARRLARELLERYRAASPDPLTDALMHYYMSRRAATRAKIAAWHLRDEQFAGQRPEWRARAYSYLDDALDHIRAAKRALGSGVLEKLGDEPQKLLGPQWLARDAQVPVGLQAPYRE